MTKTKLLKITDKIDTLERKVRRLKRLMSNPKFGPKFMNAWMEIKLQNMIYQ